MEAVPTKYNGVVFRSRLEAIWACFFDQCDWVWTYEPCVWPGWIPDFKLESQRKKRLLVEVKPIDLSVRKPEHLFLSPYKKAIKYAYMADILLIGARPFVSEGASCIGYLIESVRTGNGIKVEWAELRHTWDCAAFKVDQDNYGVSPLIGLWDDWIAPNVGRKRFDDERFPVAERIFDFAIERTRGCSLG